jgi:hypothetical protein
MLFFIIAVAAIVGIAVYVTKKTKTTDSTIPTTPPSIPTTPPTSWGEIDLGTPNPPKFETSGETSGETEITPAETGPVNTDTPKMSAKPKKKVTSQPTSTTPKTIKPKTTKKSANAKTSRNN